MMTIIYFAFDRASVFPEFYLIYLLLVGNPVWSVTIYPILGLRPGRAFGARLIIYDFSCCDTWDLLICYYLFT